LIYGYISAFTKLPIPHAVNSRDAGAGKTYLLVTVASYFPSRYIIELAGMSDKALVHRPGTMVISEYNEETGDEETHAIDPIIDRLELEIEEIKGQNKQLTKENKEKIKAIEAEIRDVRNRAEKLIDLDNQIILCLDTLQDSLLNTLMSLMSQDTPRDQKYTFAEKSVSGQIRTRVNRLRGMPVLFTTRVIDDTRALRFDEKNRRFIQITPDTSSEKIRAANRLIGLKYGCLPEEYDELVVSRDDKEKAKRTIKVLITKLMQQSKNLKPKDSGIKIPGPIIKAISNSIPAAENQVWSMTVELRLMKYLAIITKVNMDDRPKVLDRETGQRYPIAIFDDLEETLELMERAASSVRPYVARWFNDVFITAFRDRDGKPNELRDDLGNVIAKESHVGVTTEQLAEKTKEVFGGIKPSSRELLTKYIYPLINQGIIDKVQSRINGRFNIFFPVEEGNIFSLFEKADVPRLKISNPDLYPTTDRIEKSFRFLWGRYYKDGVEKRYSLIDVDEKEITPQELAQKYFDSPESCFTKGYSEIESTPPASNNVQTDLHKKDIDESADHAVLTQSELDNSRNSSPEYRSEVSTNNGIFPRNLIHDPKNVLNGMLVLKCPFCTSYKTPIEFDMVSHLREMHGPELANSVPSRGKCYNMSYRIECAIENMKRKAPAEYYGSRNAEFGQRFTNVQKPMVERMSKAEPLDEWFGRRSPGT